MSQTFEIFGNQVMWSLDNADKHFNQQFEQINKYRVGLTAANF